MGTCLCKTIPDGEHWALKEASGEVKIVEGPTRVCQLGCDGREFEQLDIVVAQENEYLRIKFRDGRSEIRNGPAAEVVHPVEHISVVCHQAVQLDDQEIVVVYRQDESGCTKRDLVRGPCLYMPKTQSEWIHEFCWTGPDPSSDSMERARKKVGALRFTKLRSIPAKMYFDVENVRTKDNALITVKLMIFYQLVNVDRMLDNTNDPMGDFVNAVSADVIEWCSPKKFDDFLHCTDQLNTLGPYTQLKQSGENIGYSIDRVVFRGYVAPSALQRMHDNAIEKRTSLSLQKETEEEEQKMADFKLQKDSDRQAQEQRLALDKLNHEIAMKQKTADAAAAVKKTEAAVELERLTNIRKLDRKGEMATYLMAKDCQLPTVVNCATMMGGQQGNSSGLLSGLRLG
jgi:hypothetical protein